MPTRPTILIWVSVLLLAHGGVGCGAQSGESSRGLVLASTGSVIEGPNGVSVSAPAGSVRVDTEITIVALPPTRRPAAATPVTAGVELQPSGAIFLHGLVVKMTIDSAALPPGATLDDVVVYRADHQSDVFVPLPTRRVGAAVEAITEHFSDFVAAVPVNRGAACGDGMCSGTETCLTCPIDCGLCLGDGECGNLRCESSETCSACAFDCACVAPMDAGVDAGADGGADAGVDAEVDASTFFETYTDIASGLEWMVDYQPGDLSWADAILACDTLVANGVDDWHLGTRSEFTTLLDFTTTTPSFDTTKITVNGGDFQWTATASPSNPTAFAYMINSSGGHNGLNQANLYRARCVRTLGPPASVRMFVDNLDGTVVDTRSGLVWQQVVSAATTGQGGASTACTSVNLGAFATGWRLPSIAELTTLIDDSLPPPSYVLLLSTGNPTGNYWSSSPSGANGYAINFGTGIWVSTPTASQALHRCVH